MITTHLGKTDLEVVRIGIGGGYKMDADGYRAALDMGLNYIDTARVYLEGTDEEAIGEAIRGRRDSLILATKVAARDAAGATNSLEASLKALGTDYLDIWQMHWVNTAGDLAKIMAPGGAMEVAWKAREEGKIRFIGVTGHDWVQVAKDIATGLFDTVLLWYNCAMREADEIVLPIARQLDMGVVIMDTLRWGKLLNPPPDWPSGRPVPKPSDFYRFALCNPDIDVVTSGVQNPDQMRENIQAAIDFQPMTPEEMSLMISYGDALRKAGTLEEGA